MKKKKVIFSPKLFLQKDTIAALNMDRSNQVLGGNANTIRDANSTPPCGTCNASLDTGCASKQWSQCRTVDNGQGICCAGLNTLVC